MTEKKYKFNIGDYVVCPGDGVGQILNIEEKDIGGDIKSFYIIKILSNGMTYMGPTSAKDSIRELVTNNEVSEVYELLQEHDVKVDNSTWNRRHRDYMAKINSGSLLEIADVLRSLFLLKSTKNLSYGERQLLEKCKGMIAQEISLSQGAEENSIVNDIEAFFNA